MTGNKRSFYHYASGMLIYITPLIAISIPFVVVSMYLLLHLKTPVIVRAVHLPLKSVFIVWNNHYIHKNNSITVISVRHNDQGINFSSMFSV